MTLGIPSRGRARRGLTLVETLVYIVVLAVLMTVAFGALGRMWSASGRIRRQSDDLRAVLAAGERWREDIRRSDRVTPAEGQSEETGFVLHRPDGGEIRWRRTGSAIQRREGPDAAWVTWVERVRESAMSEDPRERVTAFRWDLLLEPAGPRSRLRRQFAFIAVPRAKESR